MIRIGTSGYSFDDWHGPFYPPGLARGKRLDFYVRYFRAVEINSTYYRMPHPAVMFQIVKKAPEEFRFMVKLHQDVTHKNLSDPSHFDAYFQVLRPFEEAGKFHGALAQFPWSFQRSRDNVDHLRRIRERMGERPVYVEFRHESWAREETFQELRDQHLGFCVVDEPRMKGLFPPVVRETNGTGYVRFHGRNAQHWWGGDRDLRYSYNYSDQELMDWVKALRDLDSTTTDTYLFFNNCHAGRAAVNAMRMSKLLNEVQVDE
jgi:uncharacterized protein YecE (DUF72 family)